MILSMKNKYIIRSRISQKKFREILKYFAEDIEATKIANLTGISRISINKILKNIRILMASECEKISKFSGEIEIDESYFFNGSTFSPSQVSTQAGLFMSVSGYRPGLSGSIV